MAPAHPKNHLVFVVDDDRAQRAATRRWLKTEGYSVMGLDSGEACLEALNTVEPAAICLDLHMDGLDGLETLRRIRERFPRIPVFMVTASSDVDAVVEAKKLGASDYLLKPMDPIRLLAKLRAALYASKTGD